MLNQINIRNQIKYKIKNDWSDRQAQQFYIQNTVKITMVCF
jgi:hypothetical protein